MKRQRKPRAKAGSDKKKQKKDQEDDKADADEASEVSGEAGGSAEAGSIMPAVQVSENSPVLP